MTFVGKNTDMSRLIRYDAQGEVERKIEDWASADPEQLKFFNAALEIRNRVIVEVTHCVALPVISELENVRGSKANSL